MADAFTSGSTFPLNHTNQDNYELQNYTSITHGTQFIKFGVRFREETENNYSTNNFLGQFNFDSIGAYAIMQQGIALGCRFRPSSPTAAGRSSFSSTRAIR